MPAGWSDLIPVPSDSSPGLVVMTCTDAACGLRYPTPVTAPRFGACPRCEAPAAKTGTYPEPASHPGAAPVRRVTAVFDSIRSALNVGTMLRTADAGGVAHVHLCGLTADAESPKVAKTALGAERAVPSAWSPDVTSVVGELRASGLAVWAVESTTDSIPLHEAVHEAPDALAVVVGNEIAGVDPAVLEAADRHVHLEMAGLKDSLNVAVAFGVVIEALRR